MTKQKCLRKIFEWIIIYCCNVARDNAPYFPLPGPNHLLLNFNTKMQDVKRFVLKLQVKGGLNNLIFSIGFQMSKI